MDRLQNLNNLYTQQNTPFTTKLSNNYFDSLANEKWIPHPYKKNQFIKRYGPTWNEIYLNLITQSCNRFNQVGYYSDFYQNSFEVGKEKQKSRFIRNIPKSNEVYF